MKHALVVLCLMVMGCGSRWSMGEPDAVNDNEAWAISEVARFAKLWNVKVHGEMTDKLYAIKWGSWGCNNEQHMDCHGFAWYDQGTVYFYRPDVNKTNKNDLTNNASHEVCHAVTGPMHDTAHWNCMAKYAQPTYPHP